MLKVKQELCQNMYNAVYLPLKTIFVHFLKLLNTHENGHICTIMDDRKCLLMI